MVTTTKVEITKGNDIPARRKQTAAGVIPETWEITRLGDIATIATGNTPPTQDLTNYGDEYPFVSPVDIGEAKYVANTEKRLSKKGFTISRRFPAGSILFVSIGSTIGKCGIAPIELTSNQQINAIFPSPSFSVDYLYYIICAAAPRIRGIAGEQAVPIVNKAQFSGTMVPLAPFDEQHVIAEALSDVDGLLGALGTLIAKKRVMKQATMQPLLTGKTRLPGFSEEWETLTIGDVEQRGDIKLFRGKVISQRDIDQFPGEYPIYSSSVHSNGLFGTYGDYMFDEDLITWSVDGGGHFFFRPKHRFSVTNVCGYIRILTPFVDYRYLAYHLQYLHSQMFFDYTLKAHPSVIRGSYNISLPQLNEQRAIAAVLCDMDAEIATLELHREKARAIKQGMMQQLLTGRVRLVKAA